MSTTRQLLNSVQVARFVAHGFLRLDGIVPREMNEEALAVFAAGLPSVPYGTPVPKAFPQGSFARRLVELPAIAGALESLVGPEPTVDHHFVHIREPREGSAQPLHADALIDPRPDAFDVQLMYYPREVTAEMGGTLIVPGSHLRRTNESDTGRYQNLRGQTRLTCPAGTIVLLHHGIWHGGRRNDSDTVRHMYKIRFNPTVPQVRLWDTADLDAPAVREELGRGFPWYEQATGRLELLNRVRLWRLLSDDPAFDIEYWAGRIENRPAAQRSQA
ncbi:phytanoyl-CoA dioxygenase family protein [Streptomyces sp. NPDC091972]|uniref:phytanoyl-CoA dioxygenase family protein n=1 Tax=unclassified Streptomyces TaxID=2593676 RepID=UPI0034439774